MGYILLLTCRTLCILSICAFGYYCVKNGFDMISMILLIVTINLIIAIYND